MFDTPSVKPACKADAEKPGLNLRRILPDLRVRWAGRSGANLRATLILVICVPGGSKVAAGQPTAAVVRPANGPVFRMVFFGMIT